MMYLLRAAIGLVMTVSVSSHAAADVVNIDDLVSGGGFLEYGGLRFDQFSRSGDPGSFWVEPITTTSGSPGLRYFGEASTPAGPGDDSIFYFVVTSLNSNIYIDGMTGTLTSAATGGGNFSISSSFNNGSTILGTGGLSMTGNLTTTQSAFSSAVLSGTVSNHYGTLGPLDSGEISVTQAFTLRLGASGAPLILPTTTTPGTFVFTSVPSGIWYDPATAYGFTYQMTAGSLFTDILNFPGRFGSALAVSSPECTIPGSGGFGEGSTVNFATLCGGGVSTFTITGINPLVDPDNPSAFPLQLAFNTPTASFTMQPVLVAVPEPASVALLFSGVFLLLMWRRGFNGRRNFGRLTRGVWILVALMIIPTAVALADTASIAFTYSGVQLGGTGATVHGNGDFGFDLTPYSSPNSASVVTLGSVSSFAVKQTTSFPGAVSTFDYELGDLGSFSLDFGNGSPVLSLTSVPVPGTNPNIIPEALSVINGIAQSSDDSDSNCLLCQATLSSVRSPWGPMLQHGVEQDQQLSHAGGEHDLLGFPRRAQALVERANDGIEGK
jgi:hypothetical protein